MKKIAYSFQNLIAAVLAIFSVAFFAGCASETEKSASNLTFQFRFDPNQSRLNNLGQPSVMPSGHAGQSPRFNTMSSHYIELAPEATTQLGNGVVVFKNQDTMAGGATAIDFSKSTIAQEGEVFLSVPLKDIAPGTYKYLRVSLAYQNYDIDVLANGFTISGTIASFVGYNTFLTTHKVKSQVVNVNANKKQGYWAFESPFGVTEGQAPEGATTVPNPLASTSPIPAGSCVVTGQFATPLVITGNETSDIGLTLSLSINQSFEWIEITSDGKFEPLAGEQVVDMGLRGLIPIIN